VNLLPIAVMSSLFPILSRAAMADDQFRQYLRLSFRSLMAMAFAGCIFATLFAGPIVHLIYGVKFSSGAAILAVLIWSEVPIFFGVVMANGLVAKNLQNYLPLATGVGAVVNVGLNLFLIPRSGAMGAAWATNISYALAGMLIYLLFQRTRSLAWLGFRVVTPPCLLAVFIIIVLKITPLTLLPRFIAALGLCGLGSWLLGIVRKSDVDQLTRLIGSSLGFLKANAS
jgi:O-antigen/teichoic acid export membrane protein